jgi:hypothetical protein
MLESYLLGIGAVIGLTLGWIAVQTAWSRAFPDATADADVLARRTGCHGCGCSTVCERKVGGVSTQERTR